MANGFRFISIWNCDLLNQDIKILVVSFSPLLFSIFYMYVDVFGIQEVFIVEVFFTYCRFVKF